MQVVDGNLQVVVRGLKRPSSSPLAEADERLQAYTGYIMKSAPITHHLKHRSVVLLGAWLGLPPAPALLGLSDRGEAASSADAR